jgi:hypothetical protein
MKKLLLIFSLLLVLSLGACNIAPDDTDLENRVDILETQVNELEQILIDLEVIEGLNKQREYYIPQSTGVSAMSYEVLGDELDKSKAPSYVLDVEDNYITFDMVAELLVEKYFGSNANVEDAYIGFIVVIKLSSMDITQEEYMAKLILLLEELSNYDWYIIGSCEVYIQSDFNGTAYIKVPVQTMRSTFITLTPFTIYNGLYEIQLFGHSFDNELVQQYYDEYVVSELYNGYVLDYE